MIKPFQNNHSQRFWRYLVYCVTFTLFCTSTLTLAADAKFSQEKIYIVADHMTLNIESGNSEYTGNVKISQGELVLTGDEVKVTQTSDDTLEQITVIGKPARYNHVTDTGENIEAESNNMVYIASQNKLIMTDNAKLVQPDHKVSSQKIIYDTLNKIVIAGEKTTPSNDDAGNSQRVNITLTPKKAE